MKPIRVGLSTTVIEPKLNAGLLDGIGVYTNALMHGLTRSGCKVTGLSFPPLSIGGGRQRIAVGQPMPRPFECWALRDMLLPDKARDAFELDLYHATDYRIVGMRCPVVATLHDAVPIKYPQWVDPKLRRIKSWVQRKVAQQADHVIAVSRFAVAELVECFGIDERRVTVVHNGIDAGWLRAPDPASVEASLREFGLERGYFLFVGTLQPRKNVERIVDAYLGLPAPVRQQRQLVIVGRIGWRCEDLLRKLRAAIDNGERVVWLASMGSQEKLRAIYAGAGIFVFPSLHEGFGIPVAEAFAAGVPVVTSNATSLPEVSMGAALEVEPTSVKAIGGAMLDLVRDEALRKNCIAAGKRRAQELSWEHTVDQTIAVYQAVLSNRG
jgi:glycosyltransferase involved in cell wall biosynthesis